MNKNEGIDDSPYFWRCHISSFRKETWKTLKMQQLFGQINDSITDPIRQVSARR